MDDKPLIETSSTKRRLFVDVRTDHVHELLAFLYKPASSKSRMFAVPIHISLPQGRCAHGSHDIRCIMGIADAHVRGKGRDMRREYWIYAVERGSAAQMSVEKVRHAQRECLSERVTWFACALVKEKVEMCADEMPLRA